MASPRSRLLRAYRIADRRHSIFDGEGASSYGGRWNSPGRRVIYAAETYAGAMLEVLAHTNIGRIPRTQSWIEITIADEVKIEEVREGDVRGWDAVDHLASRVYGDRWYDQGRTAVLIVPSVLAGPERHIAINQRHPDFVKLRATAPKPVNWDERLFGRI
jgi:RES domain-containing protein